MKGDYGVYLLKYIMMDKELISENKSLTYEDYSKLIEKPINMEYNGNERDK